MCRARAWLVLLALTGLLVIAAQPVAACRVAITFEEAVRGAEYIVIGQVSQAGDPYWYEEKGEPSPMGRLIITPLEITIAQTLKGPALPGDTLRIAQVGGQIGDTRMVSTGEQYIGTGNYLLFLSLSGVHSDVGSRVSEAWAFAGSTLSDNPYWPAYTSLSQLKAVIREAVQHDDAALGGTPLAGDPEPAAGVGVAPADTGGRRDSGAVTVIAGGLAYVWFAHRARIRRGT